MVFARRRLLQGLGIGAALACLGGPRLGFADTTKRPKRLVIVGWSSGVQAEKFWPAAGALDGALAGTPVLQPLAERGLTKLSTVLRNVSHPAAAEARLTGHEAFLSLLSGVRPATGAGGSARSAGGPTFDQAMARELAKVYGPTPIESVQVGTMGNQSLSDTMVWRGVDAPIRVSASPQQTFDALFGGGTSAEERARLRAERRSILDVHRGDLESITKAVGAGDRPLLEEHLTSIRALETELDPRNQPDLSKCQVPGRPFELDVRWGNFSNVFAAVAKAQSELLFTAMKCGLTRVATMQLVDAAGELHHIAPGNPMGIAVSRTMNIHYDITHAGYAAGTENERVKTAWDRYQVGIVADLAKRFQDTPEPTGAGGTMLDHTVILAINSFANGAAHSCGPVPVFVVGKGEGGHIVTGQCVDAREQSLNQLYVSIARALGVDLEVFGSVSYGQGPLKGIAS